MNELYKDSLEGFIGQLKKENVVFYAPTFPDRWRQDLQGMEDAELESDVKASPSTGKRMEVFYVGGKKGNNPIESVLDLLK